MYLGGTEGNHLHFYLSPASLAMQVEVSFWSLILNWSWQHFCCLTTCPLAINCPMKGHFAWPIWFSFSHMPQSSPSPHKFFFWGGGDYGFHICAALSIINFRSRLWLQAHAHCQSAWTWKLSEVVQVKQFRAGSRLRGAVRGSRREAR